MHSVRLAVQFSGSSFDDLDNLMRIEGRLVEALGISHHVVGHDFESGTASVFIDTRDEAGAKDLAESVMEVWGPTQSSIARIGVVDDSDRKRRVWPIGSSAGLSIPTIVARSMLAGVLAGGACGFAVGAVLGGELFYTAMLGALFGAVVGLPLGVILGVVLALAVRERPHRHSMVRGGVAVLAMPSAYLLFALAAKGEPPPSPVNPAMAITLSLVAFATWALIPAVLHQAPPTWIRSLSTIQD